MLVFQVSHFLKRNPSLAVRIPSRPPSTPFGVYGGLQTVAEGEVFNYDDSFVRDILIIYVIIVKVKLKWVFLILSKRFSS